MFCRRASVLTVEIPVGLLSVVAIELSPHALI